MRVENGQTTGDITITDAVTQRGQITGKATVESGGELLLYGMCGNGLTVKKGGKAIIYGTVNGNVLNDGGYLEVLGIVNGHVRTPSGETKVHVNAVIFAGGA